MRRIICILLIGFTISLHAQDSTAVVKKSSKLAILLGLNYSNLMLKSQAYFVTPEGKVGKSNVQNSVGISIGLGYNVRLNNWLMLRPGVEGNITPANLEFDSEIDYRTLSDVFPLCVETPMTFIFSKQGNANLISMRSWPEIQLGLRPVFAIPNYLPIQPVQKHLSFNIDLGIGYAIRLKKSTMRSELVYSLGLTNIIGEDNENYKTYSVQELKRSFVGLRLFFN